MSAPVSNQPKPRKVTKQIPDINWIKIPAGKFTYGSKEDRTEKTLYLDTFYISQYPITNAQYQCFFDDGGYENDEWWQDLEKITAEESYWPQLNRPKTDVNWYEAIAFCHWLSVQLGYLIQLPTEQQWEKAARGANGLRYPWGNSYQSGYANIFEPVEKTPDRYNLQTTCAVGLYPHGNSPNGIADMAGNVWEWCINRPEEIKNDLSEYAFTMRGGSWGNNSEYSTCYFRNRDNPNIRDSDLGFRICSTHPAS